MKINILGLMSTLHDKEVICESIKEYTTSISNYFNSTVEVVGDIDDLYKDADLSLFFVLTGGSEQEFKKIFDKTKDPIYLLSIPYNNSLASSMEILSFLHQNGRVGKIIHGDKETINKELKKIINKDIKEYQNIGVFGKPSDWLIASDVNYYSVKEKFNYNIINISLDELTKEYNKILNTKPTLSFKFSYQNELELYKAEILYLALKELVKKYNLVGLTIRCFDLINSIHSTSCLALSMLNDEGIVSGCEGDIPTLLSMLLVRKILNKESFMANPSKIDSNTNEIVFAHCTIPLKMTKSYKFLTHYESNSSVGIKGELREEDITLFKISPDLSNYYIEEGKIISNLNEENLCRTQIKIKLKDTSYFLNNPYGNHHVIVYGKEKERLEDYLNNII